MAEVLRVNTDRKSAFLMGVVSFGQSFTYYGTFPANHFCTDR